MSRSRQFISVKDWGDTSAVRHDRKILIVLFSTSMFNNGNNVLICFIFYGEEIKFRGGMQTSWPGTWN